MIVAREPWSPVSQSPGPKPSQVRSRKASSEGSKACVWIQKSSKGGKVSTRRHIAFHGISAATRLLNVIVLVVQACERLEKEHDDDCCVKQCPSLVE